MSKLRKLLAISIAVLSLSAVSITALAVSAYSSPAEVVAALTGKSVSSIVDERQDTGNSYGTIAREAGVLDEFKSAMLENKKGVLEARVASGDMTQEQADEILAAIEANMAACNGSGGARIGQRFGAGFGSGMRGLRNGNGYRGQDGQVGYGQGNCSGLKLQRGFFRR